MADADILAKLLKKVEYLCARCELLRRENLRLQRDKQKMHEKREAVKQELANLIKQLPEHEE